MPSPVGTLRSAGHQFGRSATLLVGKAGAPELKTQTKAIDLSALHFRFQVRGADNETPNTMSCRVYNLSSDTVNRILSEYDQVSLQAGYANSAVGVIFQGTIKQIKSGRENSTDTFLEIQAADLDLGYNFGFLNQTLKAGSSLASAVKNCAKQMGVAIDPGAVAIAQSGGVLPRGRVQFGLARLEMRSIADSLGARWFIDKGVLYLIKFDAYLPGEATVLLPNTGLVGFPEATDAGIEARCFLNPLLKLGAAVQLPSEFINSGKVVSQLGGIQYLANTSSTGLYRVLSVEHTGDNRGPDWYSDIICLRIDPSSQTVNPFP